MKATRPKILVAPLDWGLGHATRCIPVIRSLMAAGCEVLLAGEGKVEVLLKTEFPLLQFLPINGYRVSYGKNKLLLMAKVALQIPQILKTIRYESEWLDQIIKKENIDAVISDNRYGLHNKQVYSVFIIHQLMIKTPFGKLVDLALQKFNYKYINHFNECWVPDLEGKLNLAGELSHPSQLPKIPVQYIGILSRFESNSYDLQSHYLLIILSGPEPQRTILENKLIKQLESFQQPVLFIRGLPGNKACPAVPRHITIINHLSTNALQKAIQNASFVLSRCGYSSVMDLITLKKKTILIPTPGQTEQEYLAKHLMKNNLAFCISQSKLKIDKALELAASFEYQSIIFNNAALKETINDLLMKV
jgi:UDP-N-acetylglucosamine transferase subunit ALG13